MAEFRCKNCGEILESFFYLCKDGKEDEQIFFDNKNNRLKCKKCESVEFDYIIADDKKEMGFNIGKIAMMDNPTRKSYFNERARKHAQGKEQVHNKEQVLKKIIKNNGTVS